jgi:hypothetical protein
MLTRSICVVLFVLGVFTMTWAQSSNPPAEPYAVGTVFGPENPPVSSLEEVTPNAEARSFIKPGLHFSESINSNGGDRNGEIHTVSRGFGSLELQRTWQHYRTNLNYVGGGAFYTNRDRDTAQLQDLSASQQIFWKRGLLVFRDSFSYLPEGAFGHGSFGGAAGGGGGGEGEGGLGGGHFGSLGQTPRLTNEVVVSAMETLSSRSAVTAAATYGTVHFTDDSDQTLINSRQISAHAGYSYQINRTDQVGLLYGYQNFHFPREGSSKFATHLVHATYSHRISERMDLTVAGGPQFTLIDSPIFDGFNRVSFTGRAALKYSFPHTEVRLSYRRYTTSGSGLFAGAQTNGVRLSATRPLSRLLELTADLGYSHNSRILPRTGFANAHSFQSAYAGLAMRRKLTRDLSGVVRYQFTNFNSDVAVCGGISTDCGRLLERHTVTFGLDWYFHPIRLD